MKEGQPTSGEHYLSFTTKAIILLGGPNVLTRTVTEGILDREDEIKSSKLGRSVIKIARQKVELIKKGILKDANSIRVGEAQSIASMIMDIKKSSQESYEKTLTHIRNLAISSYRTSNKIRG